MITKMRSLTTICVVSVFCCMFFLSCGNGKKGNPKQEKQEEKMEDSASAPVMSEKAILYLDCSGSMAGYLNATKGTVRFKDVLNKMLYWKPAQVSFFDVEARPELSVEEFSNLLSSRHIPWSDESNLSKMIETMVGKVNSGSAGITYLLTDGIMSGTNEQIRINRNYNKDERFALQGQIEKIVHESGENVKILVVKYLSNFTGTYYCYTNADQVRLNESQRPFYVIAIGRGNLINDLENEIKNDAILAMNDGVLVLGKDSKDIAFRVDLKDVQRDSDGTLRIKNEIKLSDSVSFKATMKNLPEYMRTQEYVNKNGEIYIRKSSSKGGFDKLRNSQEVRFYVSGDNLAIRILAVNVIGNSLIFKLKYESPKWVEESSCDDDLYMKEDPQPKTFNLKYLIDGLSAINESMYVNAIDTVSFK